jgi:Rho termination factor, N-terminal domain
MATQQQQQPDYWQMTNKELVVICKQLGIQRWSGKRKKDLIALIKLHSVESLPAPPPAPPPTLEPTPLPTRPPSPLEREPYEFLDETLMEHANRARAYLPKSPTNLDENMEPAQEWSAAQTTPATEAPMVRLPVGMAAISFADMDNIRFIEY